MRSIEKTTKTARFFVENADFLEGREKCEKKDAKKCKKRLTGGVGRGIIGEQMKQNSRSHPAAVGAQRLICSPFSGYLACGVFASRDFLFCRAGPGNGGTLLLATQKIC